MAASKLTLNEQKMSLAAKKKKKKVIKNVLGLPTSVRVEFFATNEQETVSLRKVLERVLPTARIPIQENGKHDEKDKKDKSEEDLKLLQNIKVKRSRLSIGVNDLNRSIKKKIISAALVANDIYPKFLVQHIDLLCKHNNVPCLHVPGLRQITETTLGFSCIAMGFKKDFEDFREAVSVIETIFKSKNEESKVNKSESDISEDSDTEIRSINERTEKDDSAEKETEVPFTYLYRSSNKERVFIPENHSQDAVKKKSENDFISLGNSNDTDNNMVSINIPKAISANKTSFIASEKKEKKKRKNSNKLIELETKHNHEEHNDEDYEMPKKKQKLGWSVDKVGDKRNFKYSPTNIVKLHSNDNRKFKKNK